VAAFERQMQQCDFDDDGDANRRVHDESSFEDCVGMMMLMMMDSSAGVQG